MRRGVKFFLFPALAYDNDLPNPIEGGVGHVSFIVEDLEDLVASLTSQGIEPLRGPYISDVGELGRRKVAFYRSPNGTIIEPQELMQ